MTPHNHNKEIELAESERILFQDSPQQTNLLNLIIIIGVVIVVIFEIPKGSLLGILHALLFLILYTFLFIYKLTLTTHRVIKQYPFGIKLQIQQTALIQPPFFIQYRRKSGLFKSWSSSPQNNTMNYPIHFKQSEPSFLSAQFLLSMHFFTQQEQEQLIQALQQYWKFDPQFIAYEAVFETRSEQELARQQHDIGQRPLYLLITSVILGLACLYVPFKGVHFGIESYLGLIPASILAFTLCYYLIRTENKKHPLATALVSSILLSLSLYAVGLHLNRWYSESNPSHVQTHLLKLTEIDSRYQTWQLTPELQEKTGLNKICINQKWAGFKSNLKTGKFYSVPIYKGYFKDYWIQTDAFQQLEPIQESEP